MVFTLLSLFSPKFKKTQVVGLKLPVEGAIDIVKYTKHLRNTPFINCILCLEVIRLIFGRIELNQNPKQTNNY